MPVVSMSSPSEDGQTGAGGGGAIPPSAPPVFPFGGPEPQPGHQQGYQQLGFGPPPQPQAPQQPPPAYGFPEQQPPPQPQAYGYPGQQQPPQQPPYGYAPQPGQPQWGGGWAPQPPAPKGHVLRNVLICVAAVVVVVGGVVGYFVWHTAASLGKYKLVAPASFQGLTLSDDPSLTSAFTSSDSQLSGSGQTPVSAVYGTADGTPKLISYGAYGKLLLPGTQLDEGFKGLSDGGANTVTGRTSEDPGPLGGKMQCANVEDSGVDMSVCAWADNSTMNMVLVPNDDESLPQLASLTRALRQQMEVKK